jgi:hypothetical protein
MDARRADLLVDLLTGRLEFHDLDTADADADADPDADPDPDPDPDSADPSDLGTTCAEEAEIDDPDPLDPGSTNESSSAGSSLSGSSPAGSSPAGSSPARSSSVGSEVGFRTDTIEDQPGTNGSGAHDTGTHPTSPDRPDTPDADDREPSDPVTNDPEAGGPAQGGAAPDGRGEVDVGDTAGRGRRKREKKLRRGCGKRPARAGKPLVHVIVPYSTLTGADDQPCELVGYGPIPADLARSIAADAVWKRLVTDPLSGAVLDHGRDSYRPPVALAEFVRARDLYCRMPGCRRQASNCELDHAIDWSKGGTTVDTNLYAGCLHDHRVKDRSGWKVRQTPDGRVEWTTPTGHRYHSDPHDYRPDDDPDPPLLRLPPVREPLPERLPGAGEPAPQPDLASNTARHPVADQRAGPAERADPDQRVDPDQRADAGTCPGGGAALRLGHESPTGAGVGSDRDSRTDPSRRSDPRSSRALDGRSDEGPRRRVRPIRPFGPAGACGPVESTSRPPPDDVPPPF